MVWYLKNRAPYILDSVEESLQDVADWLCLWGLRQPFWQSRSVTYPTGSHLFLPLVFEGGIETICQQEQ